MVHLYVCYSLINQVWKSIMPPLSINLHLTFSFHILQIWRADLLIQCSINSVICIIYSPYQKQLSKLHIESRFNFHADCFATKCDIFLHLDYFVDILTTIYTYTCKPIFFYLSILIGKKRHKKYELLRFVLLFNWWSGVCVCIDTSIWNDTRDQFYFVEKLNK